jgi:hypothetical protein
MAERLDRLDTAREALAFREADSGPRRLRENVAQSSGAEPLNNKGTGETAGFAPSIISEV